MSSNANQPPLLLHLPLLASYLTAQGLGSRSPSVKYNNSSSIHTFNGGPVRPSRRWPNAALLTAQWLMHSAIPAEEEVPARPDIGYNIPLHFSRGVRLISVRRSKGRREYRERSPAFATATTKEIGNNNPQDKSSWLASSYRYHSPNQKFNRQ